MTRYTALLLVAAVLAGCASQRGETRLVPPPATRTVEERILYASATWSGPVRLVRPLVVARSATLTLLPGTRVFFDLPVPSSDGDRRPWMLVTGSLLAAGTPEQPIVFSPVEPTRNDADDMVKVENAKSVLLRHCVFERGPWALHAHESPLEVSSSVFRANYGGVRFQGGRVTLRANRFERNTLAVRCLKTSPVVEENGFTGNLTGLFFREEVKGAVVRRNNFDDVEYDVKLGEGQADDVDAAGNWWGPRGGPPPAERVYDGADAPGLGRVKVDPPLAAAFVAEGGKP